MLSSKLLKGSSLRGTKQSFMLVGAMRNLLFDICNVERIVGFLIRFMIAVCSGHRPDDRTSELQTPKSGETEARNDDLF